MPVPHPGPGGLLLLEEGNQALSRRLQEFFRPDTPEVWADDWRRVGRLGPTGGLLLHALWQKEANVKRRHVLLLAQATCGYPALDEWLFSESARAPSDDERFLGLLALALGPRREGGAPRVAGLVLGHNASHMLQVGGGLALERYRERPSLPDTWHRSDDPGIVAVACLLQDTSSSFQPPRAGPRSETGRNLVLRAWLMAETGRTDDARRAELAVGLLRSTPSPPLRDAAALLLSRLARPGTSRALDTLPADAVTIYALEPLSRQLALSRGWLTAEPAARLPDVERARQTVLFCIGASPSALAAAAPRLAADRSRAGAAALALAWRRLRGDHAVTSAVASAFGPVRESLWLSAAIGTPVDVVQGQLGDVEAEAAYRFFVEERLSAADAALAVETMLWRRNEHPGLAGASLRRTLVRDLLLSGSEAGRAKYGPREPYLPAGQDPNAMCFSAAIEYFAYTEQTLTDLSENRLMP